MSKQSHNRSELENVDLAFDSDPAPKKRGRPKGSKTKPKPSVDQFDCECPTCGKTGAKVRPGNKTRNIKLAGGGVKVDTVQCNHCPQVYIRRSHYKD